MKRREEVLIFTTKNGNQYGFSTHTFAISTIDKGGIYFITNHDPDGYHIMEVGYDSSISSLITTKLSDQGFMKGNPNVIGYLSPDQNLVAKILNELKEEMRLTKVES